MSDERPDQRLLTSRLLPVAGVMDRLSLGRTAVFELLNSGELRSVKVGRRRLVSEGQIADYIARLEAKSA
ncbi:ethanolamine utilization protein EutA [Mycobacteroides abscessus]|uniref:helix-turn-helix domain-containing protein n=1 Tax=Mycobacteroides abscessus TaxID=36809 RepID=UPI0002681DC8|nr:helix-turn-helix domain-containing protein [Mycobacteroides abscessus]EIU64065.1 DNA binding domain, excisionase family [Mycobacteroides abscessus subsp. bolletii 1S-151-0930]EIU67432.1 DNA binding domain, excisionase family [Mycobacteroides abscessus subsp. bolletii 1S-152-0914]MBE5480765.1 hypothetical protein [Mycobacteroides abscessus]MBN7423266.1 ethanolamine utilization protein EutA [Mycobacteroides abscessus subsp. massiliense]MDB2205129.1 helix-turn-helix domain-containing protein [